MAGDRSFSNRLRSWDFKTNTEINGNITSAPAGYINAKGGIAGPDGKAAPRDLCGADFCKSDGMGHFLPFTDADLYNPQPDNYLYTPSSRYNVYSAGTYKLVPNASTFFEASYLNRTSDQELAPTPFISAATISKDSMYNPIKPGRAGLPAPAVGVRARAGSSRRSTRSASSAGSRAPSPRTCRWSMTGSGRPRTTTAAPARSTGAPAT